MPVIATNSAITSEWLLPPVLGRIAKLSWVDCWERSPLYMFCICLVLDFTISKFDWEYDVALLR